MSDPKDILVRILHCDSLFSDSELRRSSALFLKEHRVPNRVIKDVLGVSTPTLQGWWRDWQADQSVAAVIDRRKGYSLCAQDRDTLQECMQDPNNKGRLSVRFLSEHCKLKVASVVVMLKLSLRPLPQVLESDRRPHGTSADTLAGQFRKQHGQSRALAPGRQRVFDDALDFIQQLETGGVHNSRQQLFETALEFLEEQEQGVQQTSSIDVKEESRQGSSLEDELDRDDTRAAIAIDIDDVLSFIEAREQARGLR